MGLVSPPVDFAHRPGEVIAVEDRPKTPAPVLERRVEERLGGCGSQRGEGIAPRHRHGELGAVPLGLRQGVGLQLGAQERAALPDRPLEKAPGQRRGHECADRERAGRFAKDRDLVRVAPERGDIAPDPLERRDLVQQAKVARGVVPRLPGELGMGEESESPEPIVQADDKDALLGEVSAVLPGLRARSSGKTAAVDPHHHGKFFRRGVRGHPQVQVQAVLARPAVIKDHVRENDALHRSRAVLLGLAHAGPRDDGLGRPPAQRSHGRCRIGDPLEGAHLAIRAHHALKHPVGGALPDIRDLLGGQGRCQPKDGNHPLEATEGHGWRWATPGPGGRLPFRFAPLERGGMVQPVGEEKANQG